MKIGIVGLGLIGGSIFKALNNFNYDIVGISQSQNGILPNITNDFNTLIDCNVVFVATPMNKTLDILDKLESILPQTTIVADICSLKEFVCQKKYSFNFIPTHPMAGTEKTGFENSYKELFDGAKWIICKKDYPKIIEDLITLMGAKIVTASAKEHDEAVAIISHMPMVISQALFETCQNNKLSQTLASSGFRDMTRLALSSPEMANDMVSMNYKNIQSAILNLYSSVGNLIKNNYKLKVEEIQKKRNLMYKDGKNIL